MPNARERYLSQNYELYISSEEEGSKTIYFGTLKECKKIEKVLVDSNLVSSKNINIDTLTADECFSSVSKEELEQAEKDYFATNSREIALNYDWDGDKERIIYRVENSLPKEIVKQAISTALRFPEDESETFKEIIEAHGYMIELVESVGENYDFNSTEEPSIEDWEDMEKLIKNISAKKQQLCTTQK